MDILLKEKFGAYYYIKLKPKGLKVILEVDTIRRHDKDQSGYLKPL